MTSRRASDYVAERMREIRQRRGLTAARLAERCAELGAPEITRSVVANIETGRKDQRGHRRREVTVEELLTLAFALEVPPTLLMVPLDGSDRLQITAGVEMDPLEATGWIAGDDIHVSLHRSDIPAGIATWRRQDAQPLRLLRQMNAALERAEEIRTLHVEGGAPDDARVPVAEIGKEISLYMEWLMSLGHEPPELPPHLAELMRPMPPSQGTAGGRI